MNDVNPSKRRKARRYAVQAIYDWQLTENVPNEIFERILADVNVNKTDVAYFQELVLKVPKHIEELDAAISEAISRKLSEIDPVELAILRIACYEFIQHLEIPYKVVINEAVEQAKTFGAEDGHKFVNGALDKIAASLRALEVSANKKR
jgi:transcription antitermination protein NusB